jgi:hypothetical protein
VELHVVKTTEQHPAVDIGATLFVAPTVDVMRFAI